MALLHDKLQFGTQEQTRMRPPTYSIRPLYSFLACSVVLHGLVTVILGPALFPDSARYAPLNGFEPPIDFLGHIGSPAPLVQAVWRLPYPFPLVVHAIASGAAWAFVTCVGLAVIQSKNAAIAWFLVLTVIFWSPLLIFADSSVLTESLAISGSVACTAGSVCLVSAGAKALIPLRNVLIATVTGFGVAILSRPVTLIALTPIVAMGCAIGIPKTSAAMAALSATIVSGVVAYGVVLSANSSQSSSEVFRAENRLAQRASLEWIAAARRTGFVDCPELPTDRIVHSAERDFSWFSAGPFRFRESARTPGNDPATAIRAANCPGMAAWLKNGHMTPLEQLRYAPSETMKNYFADGPRFWLERSLGAGTPLIAQRAATVVTLALDLVSLTLLAVAAFKNWRSRRVVAVEQRVWLLVVVGFVSWFLYSMAVWLSDSSALGRVFLPVPVILAPFALLVSLAVWQDRRSEEC